MEIWKEIPGTDYSVSNEGRVESRKFGKRRIMRVPPDGSGYPSVNLWVNGTEQTRKAHILVAEAFLGPKPTPRHEVNHKNGIKDDNRVVNLEWVTRSENSRHRFDVLNHGNLRGEACNLTKLTELNIREIRTRYAAGELQRVIAADYGIAQTAVSHIVTRRSWAWLA